MCEIPDVYFSTGEFAALCGTTKATLFHYDDVGILRPAKKGDNNYRFYTDKQLFDYDLISSLTQIGTPLAEIRALMDDWDPQKYLELLDRKEKELGEREEELKRMRSFLGLIRARTRRFMNLTNQDIRIMECPAAHYSVSPSASREPDNRHRELQDLQKRVLMQRHSRKSGDFAVGSITLFDDIKKGDIRPAWYCTVGEDFTAPGLERFDRPAGTFAVFYHVGDFYDIPKTVGLALEKLESMGWRLCGDIFENDSMSLFGSMAPGSYVYRLEAQVERAEA